MPVYMSQVGVGGVVAGNPLLTGLSAQYKLNEASGNFLESVGSLDLTAVNAPGSATGLVNNCRTFNGTNYGARTLASGSALDPAGVNYSFSCWFWLTAATGTRQIFSQREQFSGTANLYLILRMEATTLKLYSGNGTGNFDVYTIGTPSTGAWHHFAGAFTNSTKTWRYRFDGGSVVSTGAGSYAPTSQGGTGIFKTAIGGETAELWDNGGKIDVCKYWKSTVLSDALLLSDYNSGAGVEL